MIMLKKHEILEEIVDEDPHQDPDLVRDPDVGIIIIVKEIYQEMEE